MPGKGVMRRIILIKVCLAVLLMGFYPSLAAGAESQADASSKTAQWQATATPAAAAQYSPRQSLPPPDTAPSHRPAPSPSRGYQGLLKFMAGGLLGGLLCALLFGYPLSLYWGQGNLPFGFLDVVVLTSAAYLGYRLLRPATPKEEGIAIPGFPMPVTLAPAVFTVKNEAGSGLAQCSHTDSSFNLAAFVEYARQMIFDLHDAWNNEELGLIKDRITEQMLDLLGMGLRIINLRGEVSRVEDLSLSQIVVVSSRQEEGRDIIVVNFQGRVVDYLLERRSFKLISGSMTYPERLQECWIFEREWGQGSWLLADIQDSRIYFENAAA
jgi:predicted lipid-binding transport protein (Tim44 family)